MRGSLRPQENTAAESQIREYEFVSDFSKMITRLLCVGVQATFLADATALHHFAVTASIVPNVLFSI